MLIRPMLATDASAVSLLSDQLGYPIPSSVIEERWNQISGSPSHGFYVAECNSAVVGWIQIYGVHLLESPNFFAEIGGLVVDTRARRQGIGRALMSQAESWAQAHGYLDVRLRSGLHRTEAHQFYQSIGYTLTKTSHMFRKVLAEPS